MKRCANCYNLQRKVNMLRKALDYLLEQTVDQDLAYGQSLTEGEKDARRKAINAMWRSAPKGE